MTGDRSDQTSYGGTTPYGGRGLTGADSVSPEEEGKAADAAVEEGAAVAEHALGRAGGTGDAPSTATFSGTGAGGAIDTDKPGN